MVLGPAELAAFVFATFAVMATPGVTVSSITGTSIAHGWRAGFAMEFGAVLARLTMIATLAVGFELVAQVMLAAFDWIKLAGAAYLIWIGINTIRHPPQLGTGTAAAPSFGRQVLSGFIILWSNPKALLFFGAFMPQFIDHSQAVLPQIVFLGSIWLAIVIATDSTYILLAGAARHLFRGQSAHRLGWTSGLILIGAGVWLASATKA